MRHIYNALFSMVIIGVLIALLYSVDILKSANISLYDTVLNATYQPKAVNTLIIEYPEDIELTALLSGIANIQQQQPQSIVVMLADKQKNHERNTKLIAENIATAKILGINFNVQGKAQLREHSQWRASAGLVLPPPQTNNTNRIIPRFIGELDSSNGHFLQQHVASTHTVDQDKEQIIDFRRVAINIPVITLDRIGNNSLSAKLIAAKHVMLTPMQPVFSHSVVVPLKLQGLGINTAQYQAIALEALQQQALLKLLPLVFSILAGVTSAIILFLLLIKSQIRWSKMIITTYLALLIPSVYLLSLSVGFIPPVIEIVLASIFVSFAFFHTKRVENDQLMAQINQQIQSRLKDSILPKSFQEEEQPWDKIASMVQQQLRLERSIFLEKIPNDHRVVEISAINCSINDIMEQRRDFHREPYLSAIAARSLVTPNRPYFSNRQPDELEFLVPFLNGVELLGFWALTIKPDRKWNRQKFAQNIESFTQQISLLIFQKQRWDTRYNRSILGSVKSWLYSENHYLSVLQNTQMLTRKVDFSHRMFETMHTASVIFDLFGQVVEINQAMERLAEEANISIFNLSALELLTKVTDFPEDSIRGKLRQIILHHTREHFATTIEVHEESFIVSVKPVLSKSEDQESDAPFQVLGLLCEFFNVAEIRHVQDLERRLYDQYSTKIKNHLSTIQMAHIQVERLSTLQEVHMLNHLIQKELQDAAMVTRNTHALMRSLITQKARQLVPFDVFETVKARANHFLKTRGETISITTKLPTFSGLGFGNLEALRSALDATFSVLEDDTINPKTIKIFGRNSSRNNQSWLYVRIYSEGYGLPKDYIQKILKGEVHEDDNSKMVRLAALINDLENWNIVARINSRLGKGLAISFIFEGLHLDDT